jgi:hypothetical protein
VAAPAWQAEIAELGAGELVGEVRTIVQAEHPLPVVSGDEGHKPLAQIGAQPDIHVSLARGRAGKNEGIILAPTGLVWELRTVAGVMDLDRAEPPAPQPQSSPVQAPFAGLFFWTPGATWMKSRSRTG